MLSPLKQPAGTHLPDEIPDPSSDAKQASAPTGEGSKRAGTWPRIARRRPLPTAVLRS